VLLNGDDIRLRCYLWHLIDQSTQN
jgi:hypothetical protein